MRELHLSDLWAIAAGLMLFLALLTVPGWWPVLRVLLWALVDRFFIVRWNMSSQSPDDGDDPATEDGEKTPEALVKRNGETGENAIATVKNEGNDPFHFPDLFTGLARLVQAKKVGETEVLKLVCEVNPGKSDRYIAARDQLHAALAALSSEPTYRPLDEELQPTGRPPRSRRK